jgi:LDH2 family malate/lactate/ureidoglycolate dehydrogenase
MSRVDVGALEEFIAAALRKVGLPEEDAAIGANVLTRTEARGIVTHGVRQVPRYVKAIQAGGVNAHAKPRVLRETPATAVVDGDEGLGHVVATRAMQIAIRKAEAVGCAAVLVRNSTHLGALGIYALMAAEAGMVGSIYTTTPRALKAPGTRTAALGTGPVAHAMPGNRAPFVLDIAMSVVSGNRVNMARERGDAIPLGWIVDADGRPSTDPTQHRRGGALVAIAGHKGYGMALFGELLAGALAGLDWDSGERFKTHQPGSAYFADLKPEDPWNAGHAIVVLDVKAFMDPAEFRERVDRLTDALLHAPRDPESDGVKIPGHRAHEAELEARRAGVELSASTLDALTALATELGISARLTPSG